MKKNLLRQDNNTSPLWQSFLVKVQRAFGPRHAVLASASTRNRRFDVFMCSICKEESRQTTEPNRLVQGPRLPAAETTVQKTRNLGVIGRCSLYIYVNVTNAH